MFASSAFQSSGRLPSVLLLSRSKFTTTTTPHLTTTTTTARDYDSLATILNLIAPPDATSFEELHQQCCCFATSSIVLISDDATTSAFSDVAEWRQYVPLTVTGAVLIDILLGSPLANMALAPMKRATEEGANRGNNSNSSQSNNNNNNGGSLFSTLGGGGSSSRDDGTKERVDSEAIAKAALFKATNTLELRRFLDENRTDEQKYEEVRKQIDRQMSLDDVD